MATIAGRLGLRTPRKKAGLPDGPPGSAARHLYHWIARPIPWMEELARAHGSAFTIRLPWQGDVVFFSDPDAIKEIFTGPSDVLHAGEANVILEPILGTSSLLCLDGARHLRERRLLMPPLHGERMQAYGDAMREITEASMARWPTGRPFPIHPEMQGITLDVIMRAVFGVGDSAAAASLRGLLVEMLTKASNPLLLLPPLQYDLGPLTPWGGLAGIMRDVDELLFAEMRARRADPDESREDVLSLLLHARDEDGQPMTDQELRDEMMTLLLAGHETTATSLAWAFYRLAIHPEIQARAREEVDRVLGDGPIDPKRVGELEHVDAIVRETMRLNPIIPIVGRKLKAPMRIGGYDLDRGVMAAPCIYLTHRRPDIWPDPLRFDPERFVGKKISPYAWLPFGGGVRRCIGMAFALYEMKVVLATVLSRFDVARAPGERTHVVRRSISFAPSHEMPVVLTRRD
jgi:cytochrome P450